MARKRQTPLERLNDPNAIIKLFAGLEAGTLVGVLIGIWFSSARSGDAYLDVLAPYLLLSWVPIAIVIAVTGILLFKRAERKTGP